jgi:hypothetical protein
MTKTSNAILFCFHGLEFGHGEGIPYVAITVSGNLLLVTLAGYSGKNTKKNLYVCFVCLKIQIVYVYCININLYRKS